MKGGREEKIRDMSRGQEFYILQTFFILWLINMFVEQTHIFPSGAQNTVQANLIRQEGGKGARDQNRSTLD